MRFNVKLWVLVMCCAIPIARGAAFDCEKASTNIEVKICKSCVLSTLDEKVDLKYRSALGRVDDAADLRRAKREWLARVRNICADERCLVEAYERRLNELSLFVSRHEGQWPDNSGELVFWPGGVGPMTLRTPFDVADIQKLFPRYKVVMHAIEQYGYLNVSEGNDTIAIISSKEGDRQKIGSISSQYSRSRHGKNRIGSRYSEIYASTAKVYCRSSEDDPEGQECRSPDDEHIAYYFRPAEPDYSELKLVQIMYLDESPWGIDADSYERDCGATNASP